MSIVQFINLAYVALGISTLSLGGSIYAIWRSASAVNTNRLALNTAAVSAASTGATPTVNCAACHSAVARYSLTPKGPLCANCTPLK